MRIVGFGQLRKEGERAELKHLSRRRKRNQIEMPLVGATESGIGQTELAGEKPDRMWSCRTCVLPNQPTRSLLESSTIEGDSPVGEGWEEDGRYPEYHFLDGKWEAG